MGKYYTPPHETGKEYVLAIDELCGLTAFRCERLPRDWGKYTLDPLVNCINEIQMLVHDANRVRIDPKTMDKNTLAKNIEKRIESNEKALQRFDYYDTKFDELMRKIDLLKYETERLRIILAGIIKKAIEESDKKSEKEIKIEGRLGLNDISYTSTSGTKTIKLMLTHKNVEHWLIVRRKAGKLLSEKISRDYKFLKSVRPDDALQKGSAL